MKKGEMIQLDETPKKLKSISVGVSENDFLLAFNIDENDKPEYACVIPADKMQDIVKLLFSSGIEFEERTNKKIGFTVED